MSAGFPVLSHLWHHLQAVLVDPWSNCQKLEISYHCSQAPSCSSLSLSNLHWFLCLILGCRHTEFSAFRPITVSLVPCTWPLFVFFWFTPHFFYCISMLASGGGTWPWSLAWPPHPACSCHVMSYHVFLFFFFLLNNCWWVDHFPAEVRTSKTVGSTICTWCDKREWKLGREGADMGELEGVVVNKYYQSTLHIILKELTILLKGQCFTNMCWAELSSLISNVAGTHYW